MNDLARPGSSASIVSQLSDPEWERLLSSIMEGLVIPVIGPELLRIPNGNDPSARLYNLWGQALADQRKMDVPPGDEDTPLLYRVTNALNPRERNLGEFARNIDIVIRSPAFPIPIPLLNLAEITDFPLYMTTTIDHQMETALIKIRGSIPPPHVIAFRLNGREIDNDLSDHFEPDSNPVVFHLFGRVCTDIDAFAATEDALIEFSWALVNPGHSPQHLYDYLRGKTLLLLGCNFPDWLDRFFIHAMTRERGIYVRFVSEYCTTGLCNFLERTRAADPSVAQPPVDFVAELHRRWLDKALKADAPQPMTGPERIKYGAVFISYAEEDKVAAFAIRRQLEDSRIDTWMDESGLAPGAEFKAEIHENIDNSAFFLVLISHSLDPKRSGRSERFVFTEWEWAIDAAKRPPHDSRAFLQPVVIDNTPPDADFVGHAFPDLNWTDLTDGLLPNKFIDFIRKGVRSFRDRQQPGVRP